MTFMLILQFLVLMFVVCGTIIFFLHKTLVSSTEGAVKRLNNETEEMRAKQKELNEKIKEADEELAKRKKEAAELANKMIEEAEEKAKAEREDVVKKARAEGEEIIAKAQRTQDKMRKAIEVELQVKMADFSMEILNKILSDKARGALNDQLMKEFIENLEKVDMSTIGHDIDTADIVTVAAIEDVYKKKIKEIIENKLKRPIKINATIDNSVVGGVMLQFGSLALDGSLKELIYETGSALKKKIEDGLA